ncbi:E3 ubiquitin-protein ligase [Morus notabilis]|uniref:RING-type E3 ubiquitin transferase n=1 Tax=Morus notabilis TaxID=981085 RepID=W9S4S7_9ROSA|nr:E3 ubiquitin-protein ligase [Morus notabilis]
MRLRASGADKVDKWRSAWADDVSGSTLTSQTRLDVPGWLVQHTLGSWGLSTELWSFVYSWLLEGATKEDIDRLPKFKFRKISNFEKVNGEIQESFGGVMIDCNTDPPIERVLSREDAECCICLSAYDDGTELRELPCHHHFHCSCIDKWLHINAICPLCKFNILKPGGEELEEKLQDSPSRKDGIDKPTETTLRIYGCDLIQESGILLRLPQAVNGDRPGSVPSFLLQEVNCPLQ